MALELANQQVSDRRDRLLTTVSRHPTYERPAHTELCAAGGRRPPRRTGSSCFSWSTRSRAPPGPTSRGSCGIGELRQLGVLNRDRDSSGRRAGVGGQAIWRGEPARRGRVGSRVRHEEAAAIRLRQGSFRPDNLDPVCCGGRRCMPSDARDTIARRDLAKISLTATPPNGRRCATEQLWLTPQAEQWIPVADLMGLSTAALTGSFARCRPPHHDVEADVVTEVATQRTPSPTHRHDPRPRRATCVFRGCRVHSSLDGRRPCLWP
jgi:hypothetical protein